MQKHGLWGCLVAVAVSGAWAQAAPPSDGGTRVAVVDIAAVFEQFKMTKDLEQRFEATRQEISQEADKKREALETKRRELEAFAPDSKDFQDRRKEFTKSEFEFKYWVQEQEENLKGQHKQWMADIYTRVRAAVKKLAEQRGLDLVLTLDEEKLQSQDSATLRQEILLRRVLYSSDRINLTKAVLDELQAQYSKEGGAPPPSGSSRDASSPGRG